MYLMYPLYEIWHASFAAFSCGKAFVVFEYPLVLIYVKIIMNLTNFTAVSTDVYAGSYLQKLVSFLHVLMYVQPVQGAAEWRFL